MLRVVARSLGARSLGARSLGARTLGSGTAPLPTRFPSGCITRRAASRLWGERGEVVAWETGIHREGDASYTERAGESAGERAGERGWRERVEREGGQRGWGERVGREGGGRGWRWQSKTVTAGEWEAWLAQRVCSAQRRGVRDRREQTTPHIPSLPQPYYKSNSLSFLWVPT